MTQLALLVALMAKHFLCDFPLQRPYQYQNKGIYGHPGGLLHVSIHAAGTWLVAVLFVGPWAALGLALLDAVIHYHIDWAKNQINKRYSLNAHSGAWYWIVFGFDQFLHQLTYILLTIIALQTGMMDG
ncbi:MAG: DUF3307 domain-containing protein [Rickettsiales bacterium]